MAGFPCIMACLAASVLILLSLPVRAISPVAPPPPDVSEAPEDQRVRLQRLSTIPFVQLEVTAGHDTRLNPYGSTGCVFEAVVRRSFQRSDMLPVGQQIRVRLDCTTERHPTVITLASGAWVDIDAATLIRDLRTGALLQMRLLPARGPWGAVFEKIGEVVVVSALSRQPRPDAVGLDQRARHLNDYNRLDDWTQANGRFGAGPGVPPAFPTRDVTLTYRHSRHPNVVLRALYHSSTWQMRIEVISGGDPGEGAELNDAFMRTRVLIGVVA